MADIRINQLPVATGPNAPAGTDNVAIDGLTTRRTTITEFGNVAVPIASEMDARVGTDNSKRMTALTTKQSIDSEVGETIASAAQGLLASTALQPGQAATPAQGALADTAVQPEQITPKIDTFADLATVPPSQVNVGGYLHCASIGAVYQRLADDAAFAAFDFVSTGGCKWIYIPSANCWDARAFGMHRQALDNTERLNLIEEAIYQYYAIPDTTQVADMPEIVFTGEYIYRSPVVLGFRPRRGLILRGGSHYASTNVTWPEKSMLFEATRTFTEFRDMNINTRQMCGAILFAARNRIEGCKITGFGWCGIWQKGGTPGRGTTHIINCEIGKYDQTWTSAWIPGYIWPEEPAILLEGNDTEIVNCQVRWSQPNIKVSSTGGFMTIHGGHIYAGRAGHNVDSYNLVVEAGAKACRLVGVYIDGGYCDIYNNAVDFIGCGACIETTAQTLEAFIRIFAIGPAQQTMGCQVIGMRRLVDIIPIVKLKPSGVGDVNYWSDAWQKWSDYVGVSPGMNLAMELTNSILRAASPSSQGSHDFFSAASSTGLKLLNTTSITDAPNAPELSASGKTLSMRTNNTDRVKASEGGSVFLGNQEASSPTASQIKGVTYDNSTGTFSIQGAASGIAMALGRMNTTGQLAIMRYAGVTVGDISVTASATAYNTSSDYRIKTVHPAPDTYNPVDVVKHLADAQKWFTFDADPENSLQLGWLAHELQAIVPMAVTGEKDATENIGTLTFPDGTEEYDVHEMSDLPEGASWTKTGDRPVLQGRDDSKLIPVLVAAMARLLERVDELEAERPFGL